MIGVFIARVPPASAEAAAWRSPRAGACQQRLISWVLGAVVFWDLLDGPTGYSPLQRAVSLAAWNRRRAPLATLANLWVTIGYSPGSSKVNSTNPPWAGCRSSTWEPPRPLPGRSRYSPSL